MIKRGISNTVTVLLLVMLVIMAVSILAFFIFSNIGDISEVVSIKTDMQGTGFSISENSVFVDYGNGAE